MRPRAKLELNLSAHRVFGIAARPNCATRRPIKISRRVNRSVLTAVAAAGHEREASKGRFSASRRLREFFDVADIPTSPRGSACQPAEYDAAGLKASYLAGRHSISYLTCGSPAWRFAICTILRQYEAVVVSPV